MALISNKISSTYRIDQPNAGVGWWTPFLALLSRQNERTKKVAAWRAMLKNSCIARWHKARTCRRNCVSRRLKRIGSDLPSSKSRSTTYNSTADPEAAQPHEFLTPQSPDLSIHSRPPMTLQGRFLKLPKVQFGVENAHKSVTDSVIHNY